MKTIIATLALVLLTAGPTFAASSHTRHLQEGRDFYVPQYDPNGPAFTDIIGGHHLDLNPPNPSGGIPGA
jgi:hypothetical protein